MKLAAAEVHCAQYRLDSLNLVQVALKAREHLNASQELKNSKGQNKCLTKQHTCQVTCYYCTVHSKYERARNLVRNIRTWELR